MKPFRLIALFIALAATLADGETFIGPTTSTNRLLVPTNSAIIITATFGDFTNSTQVQLGDGGTPFIQSYFAPLENGTVYALAGPAELIFSNAVLFTFYRLTNSAIYSQGIANDPIGIPIASNKTMHVFGVPAPVNASFNRPSSAGGGTLSFMLEPNSPRNSRGRGRFSSTAACSSLTPSSFPISSPRTDLPCLVSGLSLARAVALPSAWRSRWI